MTERVEVAGLKVAQALYDFINAEALPGTAVDQAAFWEGFGRLAAEYAPRNRALVAKRDDLQAKIDAWHGERRGQPHDAAAYRAFLEEIGYLVHEGGDFKVETPNVDREFSSVAGPQL
ncbi:MAG: malate synthase G, partial [Pseudomonadota bacterium]